MPDLGTRLRARWRLLLDAVRLHRRRVDGSGDAVLRSQPADTVVVDLRPRVRIPGPDAGSEGPPPEWLAYVMAQDPVWVEGGLGLSGPSVDRTADHDSGDIQASICNVSTLTSASGTGSGNVEPTAELPIVAARTGRQPRARFVSRPDHGGAEPTPIRSTPAYPASAPADVEAPARAPRRLLPRHEPASTDPATTGRPEPVRPTDPPLAALHDDRPPVWPVAISAPGSRPTTALDPGPLIAPAPTVTVRGNPDDRTDRTDRTDRSSLSPPAPTARGIASRLTSTTPGRSSGRPNAALAESTPRPAVGLWTSASSPAPVIELRRELDDRPAPVDPPVAVRWRAIDVDRLGVEQRAL